MDAPKFYARPRLYAATVEVVVVFVSDGGDLGYQAGDFAREEINGGGEIAHVDVQEIRRPEDIPPEWLDRGRETPLVWNGDDMTATGWLAVHPYVPTEAELEAVGQLSMLGTQ